jgi:octaprenyl-diphosphate synthase
MKIPGSSTLTTAISSSIAATADAIGELSAKAQLMKTISSLHGLSDVEKTIRSKLTSESAQMQEISLYLFELGGKRMRPVLTLLAGKLFGLTEPPKSLIDVAAGIELIHMATLLHDDIIDKSPLRRHKESPYSKFGTDSTLITGDFLLTRAFSLCAHLDEAVVNETERACIELTEGEILETPLWKSVLSRDEVITVARKKTAALFKLASFCGAHLAGAGAASERALSTFGESLGIAFQILDDILDVTADENLLGKRSGMDLQERKPSIVNVLWLASGDPRAQRLLLQPTAEEEHEFVKDALVHLRASAVIDQATELARGYARAAEQSLKEAVAASTCGHNERAYRDMVALVEYTVARIG